MIRVSVMYPNEKGKRFDLNYFATKHIGLVHKKLDGAGLVRSEVDKAAPCMISLVRMAYSMLLRAPRFCHSSVKSCRTAMPRIRLSIHSLG